MSDNPNKLALDLIQEGIRTKSADTIFYIQVLSYIESHSYLSILEMMNEIRIEIGRNEAMVRAMTKSFFDLDKMGRNP